MFIMMDWEVTMLLNERDSLKNSNEALKQQIDILNNMLKGFQTKPIVEDTNEYTYETSKEFDDKLKEIRRKQKTMIKNIRNMYLIQSIIFFLFSFFIIKSICHSLSFFLIFYHEITLVSSFEQSKKAQNPGKSTVSVHKDVFSYERSVATSAMEAAAFSLSAVDHGLDDSAIASISFMVARSTSPTPVK